MLWYVTPLRRISRFAGCALALALAGCLEVVDHTPRDACSTDDDCPCEAECYVPEGESLLRCQPRRSMTCTVDHDCVARVLCHSVSRDGGLCSYRTCRTP